MTSRAQHRPGMTIAELMVSISIFMLLGGISVATLGPFLSKGRLAEAASVIDAANQEARTHARVEPVVAGRFFGVRLDGTREPSLVEVIRSDNGSVTVLQTHSLGKQTELWRGTSRPSSPLTWYFQPRTGYPIAIASATAPVQAVGAVAPGNADHLSVRAKNGRSRYGVAIYEIGLVHAEEF
jgi:type II secretory pathway pseudopilin PulG